MSSFSEIGDDESKAMTAHLHRIDERPGYQAVGGFHEEQVTLTGSASHAFRRYRRAVLALRKAQRDVEHAHALLQNLIVRLDEVKP